MRMQASTHRSLAPTVCTYAYIIYYTILYCIILRILCAYMYNAHMYIFIFCVHVNMKVSFDREIARPGKVTKCNHNHIIHSL